MDSYYILLLFHGVIGCACNTSPFFYHSSARIAETPDGGQCRHENLYFRSYNGNLLHGWLIRPLSQPPLASVLFFHGNSGNMSTHYAAIMPLVLAGYQVFTFDYQGYGRSQGVPSQEGLLEDGLSALEYVRKREDVQGLPLVLFGQSLGGHLAAVVAARKQQYLDALVIEGAFSSHRRIASFVAKRDYRLPGFVVKLLVPSLYDAVKEIGNITLPKLIIHSVDDLVVPYAHGRELYEKAVHPKSFWEVQGEHLKASASYTDEFLSRFEKLIVPSLKRQAS
jgi:uncharacterized protein